MVLSSVAGCSCDDASPPTTVAAPPATTRAEGAVVTVPETPPIVEPAGDVGYTAFPIEGLGERDWVALAITDDAVVVVSDTRLVSISAEGTTRTAENPEGIDYSQGDQLAPFAAGAFAHLASHRASRRLVAWDAASLTKRFEVPLTEGEHDPPRLFASGELFVVRVRDAWIGIDAHTGAEAWRVATTSQRNGDDVVQDAAGQGIVVESSREWVRGLDARTGREIFRRDATLEQPSPIGPRGFGLLLPRDFVAGISPGSPSRAAGVAPYRETILALDGSPLVSLESNDFIVRDAIDVGADATTVAVLDADREVVVRVYEHASGAIRASAGPFAASAWASPSLARAGDRLILASDVNTVRVLGSDGREAWRGQPETECRSVALFAASGGAMPWITCRGLGHVTLYRPSTPAPRRRLHVSGTVFCDGDPVEEAVLVAGTRVRPDASGHYEIEVVVDQELAISSDERPRCGCGGSSRRVEIPTGTSTVHADLPLPEWIGGLDGL